MIAVWVGIVSTTPTRPVQVELDGGSATSELLAAVRPQLPAAWSRVSLRELQVYATLEDFLAKVKLDDRAVIPDLYGRDRDHPVLVVLPPKEQPTKPLKEPPTKRAKLESGDADDEEVVPASEWFGAQNDLQEAKSGDTTVRFLCMAGFPPVAHDAPDTKVIYERQCYVTIFDQLVEIIRSQSESDPSVRSVVINGSPGIGKSRFYLYCVFRLALDVSVRSLLPSDFVLVLNFEKDFHVFDPATRSFVSVVDRRELDRLSDNPNVVRLVEADSEKLFGWTGITVLYPSLGLPKIHRFLKNEGLTFVMPAWSLEELRKQNALQTPQLTMDDATLVDRFFTFGGIPRWIFNTMPAALKVMMNEALGIFKGCDVIDYVRRGASYNDIKYRTCLLEVVPTSADLQWEYRWEFLSNHIADRAVSQMTLEQHRRLSAFILAVWGDNLLPKLPPVEAIFKSLCHRKIENSKGALALTLQALAGETTYVLSIPQDLQVVSFVTLDEVGDIPAGTTYYKPKSKDFGGVDAFILVGGASRTCYGLCMKSNRDQVINASALEEFQEFLTRLQVDNFFFSFVVPEARAFDFRVQALSAGGDDARRRSPLTQRGITQCVVGLDVFSSQLDDA